MTAYVAADRPLASPRLSRLCAIPGARRWRTVLAASLALALSAAIWTAADSLAPQARIVLNVFALAIIGWALTDLPDTSIAVVAVLALFVAGALEAEQVYGTLGKELVWLLIASFVIAAVVRSSGLAEYAVMAVVRRISTVAALLRVLNLAIAATALAIPSTSGRAALLLPVFLVLAARLPERGAVRALALLFPTSILLSAAGSLIGAGAHFVAVDFIAASGGPRLGYASWLALGLPLALLSTVIATEIILRAFLGAAERSRRIGPCGAAAAYGALRWTRERKVIAGGIAAMVALWIAAPLHGVSIAIVALAAAAFLTWPGISGVSLKQALTKVEWELILFLAATLAMGGALLRSNAAEWLAARLIDLAGSAVGDAAVALALAAASSLAAHLLIASRTARAAVLIPALALPLAALGLDPTNLILLVVMGTGFCQTLTASAKPVALYGTLDRPTYDHTDLVRLAALLAPVMFVLLMLFALVVWPALGVPATR